MEYAIAWVALRKYTDLTGDTKQAVEARCESGRWTRGFQYKEIDGEIWVNLAAVDCWAHSVSVTGEQRAGQAINPPIDGSAADRLNNVMEAVVEALGRLSGPMALPIQHDARDVDHIARYMKRSADTVRREIVVQPRFPSPMRIPGAGRAHTLWKAREVVAWLETGSKS